MSETTTGQPEERGRILVVDDNRLNRLKLSISLEQQGHSVALAEDGRQALAMLRSQPFDVVLLDIVMPEMDGYEVLDRIKADPELREVLIIVISALEEVESAVRCLESGAEDYLPKSFDPVILRARLRASLQKKKLRDLERAYLRQEMALRQSEKLATLGKLSAGMAHELNNPAAAALRGAAQLQSLFGRLPRTTLTLDALALSPEQVEALLELDQRVQARAERPPRLDALARADREAALEAWLDERDVENAWEIAPNLVNLGLGPDELWPLATSLEPAQLRVAVAWLNDYATMYAVLAEIGHGVGRIAEIVRALKAYTYLDQAPVQTVNLHEGLDNTLVILRGKLKAGVTVHREYVDDLPLVEAYGSELNQVWTNLIDNAIDAMGGRGEIWLRTRHDGEWAIVEVEDNGPGIPEAIQSRVFDPFFTTKPPGQGTGLGLNITHSIVVQKHKGRIEVRSEPGRTIFEVRLPLRLAAVDESV